MTVKQTPETAAQAGEVIQDFFRPQPIPFNLVRVGGEQDGAYLLPDDFAGVAACFSPGVENRKDFEDELWTWYGVRSHLMDFSSDPDAFLTSLDPGGQTFERKWLAPDGAGDSMPLDEWVQKYESVTADDLILQMDIEGSEYPNLLATSRETLRRFRILVIEFHDVLRQANADKGSGGLLDVVSALSRDFVTVHLRANNCSAFSVLPGFVGRVPDVFEVTLLRKDRLPAPDFAPSGRVFLPHPRDIVGNCRNSRPIHLGAGWSPNRRPLRSWLKVFRDYSEFLIFSAVRRTWRKMRDFLLLSRATNKVTQQSLFGAKNSEGTP